MAGKNHLSPLQKKYVALYAKALYKMLFFFAIMTFACVVIIWVVGWLWKAPVDASATYVSNSGPAPYVDANEPTGETILNNLKIDELNRAYNNGIDDLASQGIINAHFAKDAKLDQGIFDPKQDRWSLTKTEADRSMHMQKARFNPTVTLSGY